MIFHDVRGRAQCIRPCQRCQVAFGFRYDLIYDDNPIAMCLVNDILATII